MFIWTRENAVLTNLLKIFCQKCKSLTLKSEKKSKFIIFSQKKDFPSNCSSGRLGCLFDDLAEKFSPKVRKLFAQSAKKIVKLWFFENIHINPLLLGT